MTIEERRAYDRAWYLAHRETELARAKERKAKLTPEQRKRYNENRKKSPGYKAMLERNREKYKSEEYRAQRRAKYAEEHKDDPMTEHRAKCIKWQKKATKTPIEDRRAKKQAIKDIKQEEGRYL